MRIPIVDIGNSKGVRIPQAVLKQVLFKDEVEMEVVNGRIVLRRPGNVNVVPDFESIAGMDDLTIQLMLRKISGTDLLIALVGADAKVKEAVFRNLSDRVRNYVQVKLNTLEKGDARDILIERSRNAISEAFMDLMKA
jgi:antitoxin component of MazEF toxin-antitoxin module